MVRTGKRRTRKKLEPLIPEAPDELNLPKYFNIIRSGGYGGAKSGEKRIEEMLPPMPEPNKTPKALRTRRSLLPRDQYPNPVQEPERLPLLARLKYHFVSLFKVEPERPVPMPSVPELNFPALYTRFPVMKTVTKTTDAAGEITVTYAQSYATIPGVVITVKAPDNVFGTVFSTTLTGFEVRLFKMDHNHGGVVDDGGLHTPTINADGNHKHQVTGTISWTTCTESGRLISTGNYTEYENNHVHPNPSTGSGGAHAHSFSDTSGGPSSTATAITHLVTGSACDSGACVNGWSESSFATSGHTHYVGGTTGTAGSHAHSIGNTGPQAGLGHRHPISNDTMYHAYIYCIDIGADLWTTADESPYHAHTGVEIPVHKHDVPLDGRVLLKNTNVTITYIAQEESS